MRVQQIKPSIHRQVSRLSPSTAAIAELIEAANCLPTKVDIPDLIMELAERNPSFSEAVASFRTSLEQRFPVADFPEFWRRMGPVQESTWLAATENYGRLRSAREVLRAIAKSPKKPGLIPLPPVGLDDFVKAIINPQGRIEVVPGIFHTAIGGVEAERIRQCPVCEAIYWAGRLDKPTCGPRCGRVLRTRRWRSKYLGQYKQQRYRSSRIRKEPP